MVVSKKLVGRPMKPIGTGLGYHANDLGGLAITGIRVVFQKLEFLNGFRGKKDGIVAELEHSRFHPIDQIASLIGSASGDIQPFQPAPQRIDISAAALDSRGKGSKLQIVSTVQWQVLDLLSGNH